jgi:hypothetical protein
MWNVEDDLLKIDATKDVCCNTCVYFSIREDRPPVHVDDFERGNAWKYLDMTVCNRSNDLVLGCFGANAVHFSFLQEYMAACIGVQVGVYNQFTNNLHVYTNNWQPKEWLNNWMYGSGGDYYKYKSSYPTYTAVPLVKDPATFDKEVVDFVEAFRDGTTHSYVFSEPFLNEVAAPACRAFQSYKARHFECALRHAESIEATDWRKDCYEWLKRRHKKALTKGQVQS